MANALDSKNAVYSRQLGHLLYEMFSMQALKEINMLVWRLTAFLHKILYEKKTGTKKVEIPLLHEYAHFEVKRVML